MQHIRGALQGLGDGLKGEDEQTQEDAITLTRSLERRYPAARTRSTSPSRSGGSASTMLYPGPCMLYQH